MFFVFNLTSQEQKVIIFLLSLSLIGLTADFIVKKAYPLKTIASFNLDNSKIDLNTADKDLLMSVPGIGPKLAGRIIEYRAQHPGQISLEDLKTIKGISARKFEKIKDNFLEKE